MAGDTWGHVGTRAMPCFALPRHPFWALLSGMPEQSVTELLNKPEAALDMALAPALFSEFIGQTGVKERLEMIVSAAKQGRRAVPHVLLSGPPGVGKSALARIVAK